MGSACEAFTSEELGQSYVKLHIDGDLELNKDYAFQVTITNAQDTPSRDLNVFRFETLRDDVVLHLKQRVESFQLEQIRKVIMTPTDTTSLQMNRITFDMMSDKFIPGSSKIIVTAPEKFIFSCRDPAVRVLSSTTTCSKEENRVTFALDTQDQIPPNKPFAISVDVMNPKFTPQPNDWMFKIVNGFGMFIDVRKNLEGFFITGALACELKPSFDFRGQRNRITLTFVTWTIMNQADTYNELYLTAPFGYVFEKECRRHSLEFTNAGDNSLYYRNGKEVEFPPVGWECDGSDEEFVTIRLPQGAGLLRNSYTLSVDVLNPSVEPNTTNTWSFVTRVNSIDENGERHIKIVDASRHIEGFELRTLEKVREVDIDPTDGSACSLFAFAWVLCA